MSHKAVLAKLAKLQQKYPFRKCDEGYFFSLQISSDTISLLADYQRDGIPFSSFLVDDVFVEQTDLICHVNKVVDVHLSLENLKKEGINLYKDWEDFLSYKPNILFPPDSFLLFEEGITYPSDRINNKIKHFFDISNFLNLLVKKADHSTKKTHKIIDDLVFLHKSRLELKLHLEADTLSEGLDGFSVVESLFNDKSHTEQKVSILKEVLYGLLINTPKEERLNYLLDNFGEFSKRFNENYQLFVSDFSFESVRQEYEESKRDYLTKLNDIFSSVQTKMLGIPISLALASIKISSIVDGITFWTNFLLAVAVVIYGIMMFFLISNQKHSLKAIQSEYVSQMSRLKHQYSEQYEAIIVTQNELDNRYRFQNRCLNTFFVMTSFLILIVISLFLSNLPWKVILGI